MFLADSGSPPTPPPALLLSQVEVMKVQDVATTSTVLNCTSHHSPATNVLWLRDGEVIEEDSYHQVNQILRDAGGVVYDNLLIISGTVIESGQYKCVVNDSHTERYSTIWLEVGKYNTNVKPHTIILMIVIAAVFPQFNNLSYNSTTDQLSWNITEANLTTRNLITPVITGCILSLYGGRCFTGAKNVTLSQCDHVFLPDYDIVLEDGANYTVQLRAMNEMVTSNFSVPYHFTTPPLGEQYISGNCIL